MGVCIHIDEAEWQGEWLERRLGVSSFVAFSEWCDHDDGGGDGGL